MTHCMLDLETWGTRPGCAIRSIGAVFFSPLRLGLGTDFYANIDGKSCIDAGLHIDPDTAEWWESQSPAARERLRKDRLPLDEALLGFGDFLRPKGVVSIWGHGASFDPPILEACFRALGMLVPWNFWNIRDTCTLFDLAGVALGDFPRDGTHHNALDDAKHQALVVQAAYKKLGIQTNA